MGVREGRRVRRLRVGARPRPGEGAELGAREGRRVGRLRVGARSLRPHRVATCQDDLAKVRRDGAFDRGEGRWTLARLEPDGGGRRRSLGGRERKGCLIWDGYREQGSTKRPQRREEPAHILGS